MNKNVRKIGYDIADFSFYDGMLTPIQSRFPVIAQHLPLLHKSETVARGHTIS